MSLGAITGSRREQRGHYPDTMRIELVEHDLDANDAWREQFSASVTKRLDRITNLSWGILVGVLLAAFGLIGNLLIAVK